MKSSWHIFVKSYKSRNGSLRPLDLTSIRMTEGMRRVTRNVYAYDNQEVEKKEAGAICWKHRENVERWDWDTRNGRRDFQFAGERLLSLRTAARWQKKRIVMTSKIHRSVLFFIKKNIIARKIHLVECKLLEMHVLRHACQTRRNFHSIGRLIFDYNYVINIL